MQTIATKVVDKLKDIITELEQVERERIRAQERTIIEVEKWEKLGFSTLDKAEKGLEEFDAKIEKKSSKFFEAFDEFTEDYSEALE